MKLSRQEAKEILKKYNIWTCDKYRTNFNVYPSDFRKAIDTAIEALGETKLIDDKSTDGYFYGEKITKCCKVGPITTEKFCPECGKKIIR